MGQHPKGPWEVAKQSYGVTGILSGSYWVVGNVDVPIENQADAHLIAAAPDLLAVCQELEASASYWSEYDVPLGIVDRLRAAITKATGATP